ncbi:MAG: hypothetical protein HYU34_05575, partial [Candidatus Omnitrophica bacterium]|nr:hypothetical protein [Candidatus Omnitrophota bacterium]
CLAGTALECDDGKQGTRDSCDSTEGCRHLEDPGLCDDGNVCNGIETVVDGNCVPGTPEVCDDGVACTTDSCDPVAGCRYSANNNLCDDDNVCTADQCTAQGCQNTPDDSLTCGDQDLCNGEELCRSGQCLAGTALTTQGCQNTPDDSLACGDPDLCNGEELCRSGQCVAGTALECDDGKQGTRDSCSPTEGCLYEEDPSLCDDHDVCNGTEIIVDGNCAPGTPPRAVKIPRMTRSPAVTRTSATEKSSAAPASACLVSRRSVPMAWTASLRPENVSVLLTARFAVRFVSPSVSASVKGTPIAMTRMCAMAFTFVRPGNASRQNRQLS